MFSEEEYLKESNHIINSMKKKGELENGKRKNEIPCVVFYRDGDEWKILDREYDFGKRRLVFASIRRAKIAISNFCFSYDHIKYFKDQELFRKRFYEEYFKFVEIDINKINPND